MQVHNDKQPYDSITIRCTNINEIQIIGDLVISCFVETWWDVILEVSLWYLKKMSYEAFNGLRGALHRFLNFVQIKVELSPYNCRDSYIASMAMVKLFL